jgi:transcriptional regulator
MRDSQLNMISDAIRNIYGNIEIEKGNKDQTVNRYTLKSPILLMGEDFGEETAATERSLRVNYSKMESKEPLRTLSYKFLKSSPDLLNKLGRALLNEALKLTPAKIKELHNNFETNSINENISTDRVRNSIANCMCGLMLIVGVFMRLKVDFEAVTGYKIKELLKAVNRTAVADTLDENHSTKSVVDLIIEKLDTFAEMGRLIKDFHYKVVDRSLMLRLPRVFDTIENDIKAKMDLSQREFSRQLMKQYYWETNQASVKMLSNKVGAEDMITVTCTKLNIDKLLERNIEIPTFSAVKPAKKNDNITKFNQVKFGSAY